MTKTSKRKQKAQPIDDICEQANKFSLNDEYEADITYLLKDSMKEQLCLSISRDSHP